MNYETKLEPMQHAEHGVLAEDADVAERKSRRKPLIIALLAVIGAGIIAFFLLRSGDDAPAFAPEENAAAPRVTVLAPGATTLQTSINATGTIAARREMPVGVVGEGGRVVAVNVDAGEWVRQGQVLAVIDRSVQNQQAASQNAQLDVAQADADLAQANLDRALQLVERGFISQADIDRLTATRDAAVARVRVARAQLSERQARNAQLNILAPAAGLVLMRNVEPGQVVSPGSGVLFSIARNGEMEVLTRIGENELGAISIGAVGKVMPAGTEQQLTCQIWQKSPVIDVDTRQGTARCAMPYNAALLPGGFARVELASGAVVAPRLPESAIMSDQRGSYVYIVGANNKVERRDVELGGISNEGIAIASGLNGRERVIMRAGGFLSEGETIDPVIERSANGGPASAASAS